MSAFTRRARRGSSSFALPVGNGLLAAGGGRAQDRVGHLGAAVAVFERRSVRRHVVLPRDRLEHVTELVDERVAPADDVAGRPPVPHVWVLGLRDEDATEVLRVRNLEL